MTRITNIILTTAAHDGAWMNSDTGSVDEISDYLYKNYQGSRLQSVEQHAGGHKKMACDVFMVTIDYLNLDELIDQFNRVKWDKPEEAQLMVKSPGDKIFTVYQPNITKQGRDR